MWLPDVIVNDVSKAVSVFYVNYAVTRLWAQNRDKGEPLVFSGWYWANGTREGGPFKSQSACYRDAWFHVVRHIEPPAIKGDMQKYERQTNRRTRAAAVRKQRAA